MQTYLQFKSNLFLWTPLFCNLRDLIEHIIVNEYWKRNWTFLRSKNVAIYAHLGKFSHFLKTGEKICWIPSLPRLLSLTVPKQFSLETRPGGGRSNLLMLLRRVTHFWEDILSRTALVLYQQTFEKTICPELL